MLNKLYHKIRGILILGGKQMNGKEILNCLTSLAEGISSMFGHDCEVIIHDLKRKGIVTAIYNGHVTGRKKGDKLHMLGIYKIEEAIEGRDFYNCLCKTQEGRLIKSTTIHFKDKGYHYAFGINYDFTKLSLAESVLSNLVKTGIEVEKVIEGNPSEKIIDDIFIDGIKLIGKPVALMNKEDRMNLVKYLRDNGGFSLKKGIQTVAKKMHISRYTIYNYLKAFEEEENK